MNVPAFVSQVLVGILFVTLGEVAANTLLLIGRYTPVALRCSQLKIVDQVGNPTTYGADAQAPS